VSHEFLSPGWIAAVRALRDEHAAAADSLPVAIKMNLNVTEGPAGTLERAHVDVADGALVVEEGHLDDVDLEITVDFATAKALLVEGNPQAAMSAFMAGKIRIQGDMAKLMVLQGASPDPSQIAFAEAVKAITS
jgi:putative sterol carrier protein